jgi:hypothetical protein
MGGAEVIVRVVQAVDREIYDVSDRLGKLGVFVRETESPSTGVPFTLVRFSDGTDEAFWPEEIAEVRR